MEFGGLKSSTNRKKTTSDQSDLEVLEGGMVWMGPPEPKKRGSFMFRLMKLMKHDFFSPKQFERIEQNIGKESSE